MTILNFGRNEFELPSTQVLQGRWNGSYHLIGPLSYCRVLYNVAESHHFKNELLSLCTSLCSKLQSDSKYFSSLMNIAKECLKDRTSSVRSSSILLMGNVIKYGKRAGLPFEDALGMQVCVTITLGILYNSSNTYEQP